MAKIAAGILILRKSKNPDWTADLDGQLVAWCNKYIDWLSTSTSGKTAAAATKYGQPALLSFGMFPAA